jgi:hypothetical protein
MRNAALSRTKMTEMTKTKDEEMFRLKSIKLFLDDVRNPSDVEHCLDPGEWVIVRTVKAAQDVLFTRQVLAISLDHDLGLDQPTGYDLCKWMSQNFAWPDQVYFHSMNPVGKQNMMAELHSYLRWMKDGKHD